MQPNYQYLHYLAMKALQKSWKQDKLDIETLTEALGGKNPQEVRGNNK